MTDDLRSVLAGLDGALLALFDADDECHLQVVARPEGPHDDVDPVSELAVLAGVARLPSAMLVIPVRMRDLLDGEVVSRSLLITRCRRLPDGRLELDACSVAGVAADGPDGPPPTVQPLDPAVSPVGSLLCDVLSTCDLSVGLAEVAGVLGARGHTVLAMGDIEPVDGARLSRARYRVHRTARELAERHRPMALADAARRPAAPANLPPGFVPACPL